MPPKFHFNTKTFLGSKTHAIINPHNDRSDQWIEPTLDHIKYLNDRKIDNITYRQFVTIDPGIINTGLYVERIWSDGQEEYVYSCVFQPLENDSKDINEIMKGGEKILDEYIELFRQSHYIIIESQLLGNIKAVRLQQHYMSLIYEKTRNQGFRPLIIEFNPELKTKLLGAPKEVKTKPQRKKWCVEKAIEILNERGENKVAEEIFIRKRSKGEGKNKKDDIADGICMVRAFKKIWCEQKEWKKFTTQ
jgi:hypothetical protein